MSQPVPTLLGPSRRWRVLLRLGLVVVVAGVLTGPGSTVEAPAAAADGPAGLPVIPAASYGIPPGALFVSPSGRDSGVGTIDDPLRTISAAISRVSAGGTVVLRGGEYRETVQTITRRVTLQSHPGEQVWLKGSDVVTGWVPDGSAWRRDGWTTRFCHTCVHPDAIDPAHPEAAWPDQVFLDGEALRQVGSRAAVVAGTFFVDYDASQLFVGSDPSQARVEASTRWRGLQLETVHAAGSRIRGIGVAHYAPHWNEDQLAAVTINSRDVVIEDSVFTLSAGTGLGVFQPGARLSRNLVIDNGYRGAVVNRAHGAVIEGNRFDRNNTAGFAFSDCGQRCTVAGLKITRTDRSIARGNTFVDNRGTGYWCDLSCRDTTVVGNFVAGNRNNGLYYEVSTRAVIASNVMVGNMRGMKLSGSDYLEVYNNTFVGNRTNIGVYDDSRAPDDYAVELGLDWDPNDIAFVNNIVSTNDGSSMALLETNRTAQAQASEYFNRLDHNAFHRRSPTQPATLAIWCRDDGCTHHPSLEAFRAATGLGNPGWQHDTTADPFFVDAAAGDYRLRPDSYAVDAGAPLPASVAAALGGAPSPVPLGALSWGTAAVDELSAPAPPSRVPGPRAPVRPPWATPATDHSAWPAVSTASRQSLAATGPASIPSGG